MFDRLCSHYRWHCGHSWGHVCCHGRCHGRCHGGAGTCSVLVETINRYVPTSCLDVLSQVVNAVMSNLGLCWTTVQCCNHLGLQKTKGNKLSKNKYVLSTCRTIIYIIYFLCYKMIVKVVNTLSENKWIRVEIYWRYSKFWWITSKAGREAVFWDWVSSSWFMWYS